MNETIKTIQSLRTIHGNFSDRKISDSDLGIILKSAVCAANSSARQCYSVVVISDKEKMRQVSEYVGDKVFVFCVDFTRHVNLAQYLRYEFAVSDMIGFVTGSTDTILAAQTACIAAKSLGIDSLFTQRGLHRKDIDTVFKALNLPDKHCFPLVALVLGYPKEEPKLKKGRLDGKGIIHFENYSKLTQDELKQMVAEYDDENLHLGLIEDWLKMGINHYLDWFYTKWSKQFDSEKLTAQLKKTGFLSKETPA